MKRESRDVKRESREGLGGWVSSSRFEGRDRAGGRMRVMQVEMKIRKGEGLKIRRFEDSKD